MANKAQLSLFDYGEDMGELTSQARYAQAKYECEYYLFFWRDRLEHGDPTRREVYQEHINYWLERSSRL